MRYTRSMFIDMFLLGLQVASMVTVALCILVALMLWRAGQTPTYATIPLNISTEFHGNCWPEAFPGRGDMYRPLCIGEVR